MGKMRKIARFLWLKWGSYVLTGSEWDTCGFRLFINYLVNTSDLHVSFC